MTQFTIIRKSRYRIVFSLQTAHYSEKIIIMGTMYIFYNNSNTSVLVEIYQSWME